MALILALLALPLPALCRNVDGLSEHSTSVKRQWTFGTELDVLPFATGGWYASLFGGYKNLRLRGAAATFNMPTFLRDNAIDEQRVRAYAVIVDFLFGRNFDGWWLGFGYENWNTVYTSADGSNETITHVMTVGGGYIWRFWQGFYMNPWCAAHVAVSGPADVQVGSVKIFPSSVTPEVSLKLGWTF